MVSFEFISCYWKYMYYENNLNGFTGCKLFYLQLVQVICLKYSRLENNLDFKSTCKYNYLSSLPSV